MNETDGKALASLSKWGEPQSQWSQDRPNTFTNVFGVVDDQGKTIAGAHVELVVFVSPYLGQVKYVFSLMKVEHGIPSRAYQLEINGRKGLKPTDHAYSHEHYGGERAGRKPADVSWANLSFDGAVELFCERCHLTLTEKLSHYSGLTLK